MAKQKGIIKLEGTLGDITFFKTQDGHLAKEKSEVPAERIFNDPTFVNTRANMSEFGRAGKAGKLFRDAFHKQMQLVQDNRVISRLHKQMMRVLQSDTTPNRGAGDRLVADGNLLLLEDFNCNLRSELNTTVKTVYHPSFDRVSGKAVIDIPGFIPKECLTAPGGTTHFKFFSVSGEVDFANAASVTAPAESPVFPWDNTPLADISLVNPLTPGTTQPVFMLLGILFYKIVNGVPGTLNTADKEALSVVKVDMP